MVSKLLSALTAALTAAGAALAAPWEQFHGSNAHDGAWDGKISRGGVRPAWICSPAQNGLAISRFNRDSQPAVASDEGLVFAYGNSADGADAGLVAGIDAASGRVLWTTEVASMASWTSNSSPVYSEGYVYWNGSDGKTPSTAYVYKMNAMNGSTDPKHGGWTATLRGEGIVNASPVAADGKVFVATYAYVNGNRLFCLDAKTGSTLWTASVNGAGGGAPAYDASRKLLYTIGSGADGAFRLMAIRASDGGTEWTAAWSLSNSDFSLGLALAGGRIYFQDFAFSGADGNLYAADAGASGALLWKTPTRGSSDAVPCADASGNVYASGDKNTVPWPGKEAGRLQAYSPDGAARWTVDFAGGVYTSPAIADGFVLVGSQNSNELYLIEAATGAPAMSLPGSGPAAFGWRQFYTIGQDGALYAYATGSVHACAGMTFQQEASSPLAAKPSVEAVFAAGGKPLRMKTVYSDRDGFSASVAAATDAWAGRWGTLLAGGSEVAPFCVPPPSISSASPMEAKAKAGIVVRGAFLGSKRPALALVDAEGKSYKCNPSGYTMAPQSGACMLSFAAPSNIPPGLYTLTVSLSKELSTQVPGFSIIP